MSSMKNLAMISVFIISYLVHQIGSSYYKERIDNNKVNPKVYDIGHRYIPDMSDNKLVELLSHVLAYAPVVYFYFFQKNMFVKYVNLNIFILFLRSISIIVTILPKHKTCDDSNYSWYNLLIGNCYDKIFSGHFSATLLGLLIMHANQFIDLTSLFVVACVQALCIIATRGHYTIDILVAAYVTWTVFKLNLQF